MANGNSKTAFFIEIKGLVQGIGFRPFVYRLALEKGITGWVRNSLTGVEIHAEGLSDSLHSFVQEISLKAPVAAIIESINPQVVVPDGYTDFTIQHSTQEVDQITLVSPDIAVCPDCLNDIKQQHHRLQYPFVNCTNCGPRFSIIRSLPYDRVNTTMDVFTMCPSCVAEYSDIRDRRFYAQPVACNDCGPTYQLVMPGETETQFKLILEKTIKLIEEGKVVALKGIGGFHLMCDALNPSAVETLRRNKLREKKPFAVMFRDVDVLKKYAIVTREEEALLTSWRRPVVILPAIKNLAPGVSSGFPTIGAMLPYTPFHHLFFERTSLDAIVLTSGNLSDEPIVISNEEALRLFSSWCGGVLVYNREIYNRNDDSVMMVINGKERIIRRSRGYAPLPVRVGADVEGIVAAGAELVNCFAAGRKNYVFLSQHIGDLKNFETYVFYRESLDRFLRLFRVRPRLIAADLHPDYLSTRYALQTGLPLIQVQHHHAHIASCMAENSEQGPVIGVAFDGTGLGDDGTIWGGEFMVCDFTGYRRITHLPYIALPGGDQVTHEPWRTALSMVLQVTEDEDFIFRLPFLNKIKPDTVHLVKTAVEKRINAPFSSGAGRWFDAVAALTGICTETGFHAEAPMRLEAAIERGKAFTYPYVYQEHRIDLKEAVQAMIYDSLVPGNAAHIATGFHNMLVSLIEKVVSEISEETGIRTVALSGGSFQNRYLSEQVENRLSQAGFKVLFHRNVPCNDGGLALGQIMIAASQPGNQ
ncbi:MAG TPA: carbamoyltransferase HypF [Bacteroidales bacterium]|nr:carbamoyltransferase HypF [Bacteroidales bacterium]